MISVLLVDDEPALLDITQIFLERDRTMAVTLSESGRDALERLETRNFDIIVADYEMPGMNGIDLLKIVKSRNIDIPFIIFTGRGREHVAIEALNYGASFYLQKGGDPKSQFAELRNMIVQAVTRKRAENEVRLNETRLQAIIELNQMTGASFHEICNYALEKAIELTRSSIGYLAFLNDDESILTMYAWSRKAMQDCMINIKPRDYPVETTGLWGEAVRQRKAIITNDYSAPNPLKKGYPEGHVVLNRHMNVPVFDGSRIVIVAGVGNKAGEYDENDVRQVTLLMGGLWQIIKRNRAEEELRNSEKKFRSYFDLPLIGIAITSLDKHWIQVNDRLCQMLGYAREELKELSWADLTPKEDLLNEDDRYQKVISGEREPYTFEKRYLRKDGRIIHAEVSAMPMRDEEGKIAHFVSFVQDITRLKQTEEEIRASNEQMAATLKELEVARQSLVAQCKRMETEEAALRLSEERFRNVIESAPWGMYFYQLSPDGQLIFSGGNASAGTILGVNHESMIGKTFEEIFPGLVNTKAPDLFKKIASEGGRWDSDQVRYDQSMISGIFEIHAFQTSPGRMVVAFMDITQRHKAEDALRRSEEKYRDLVENINDIIFATDENGILTYMSPAVRWIAGYIPEDLVGRDFSELVDPADLVGIRQRFLEFSKKEGLLLNPYDFRATIKSGKVRWFRIYSRGIHEHGVFRGIHGTITDIHEQKAAREALLEREALLQSILRAAPIGIGLLKNRVFLWANDQVTALSGYTNDELKGKSARILYPSDEEFERVGRIKYPLIMQNGVGSVESRWQRKDGKIVEVIMRSAMINPPDLSAGVIFTVSDISDKKKTERMLETINAKLTLLGRVTRHDANNRLNVLRGYIDLIEAGTDDPLLLTYTKKQGRAVNAIHSLLNFTEDYQNVGMNSPSWQDVAGAIRKSAELLDLRGITIYLDISGLEVFADPLLEKVFYNLIENALYYGEKITMIHFSTQECESGLSIICEDDGIGVCSEWKEHLFEFGFGKNTGYGLFLVSEILAMTGFSIRETGEQGKGARFEISIPKGSYRFTGD